MAQTGSWRSNAYSASLVQSVRIAVEILGLITAAVFLGFVMQRLHHANLSVLFLLAVLIIAARHGLWPSIITSALGFLAFNFFFTVPYRTLLVTEEGDIATLVFFLAVATLGGNLASRLRSAIRRRDQALDRISNLYDFSHQIAGAVTIRDILQTLVDHLARTLDVEIAVLTQESATKRTIMAARSTLDAPSDDTHGGATPNQLAPNTAELRREWTSHPARLGEDNTSRLAIHRTDLSDEQLDLVRNLCGQAELAIDRVRLTADLDYSRREAERARLQSALLTSVSHDLRTPLASIVGAASTLRELEPSLTPRDRTDLLDAVMGEARRLNGYIQNLLDMTRIEHGELQIHRDWEDPSDLISAAIRLVRENWPEVAVETRIAADVGLVNVHGELFVQALHNVLDNALRYSSPSGPVEIACTRVVDNVRIEVIDAGPGLAEHDRERIFDMFYRAEAGDRHSGGTGLGLAITRGILEAHGGQASAAAGSDSNGTRIVLILPSKSPDDETRDAE